MGLDRHTRYQAGRRDIQLSGIVNRAAQFITCKEGVQTAHRAISSDDPPAEAHHPPVKEQDSYSCRSRWSPSTGCKM